MGLKKTWSKSNTRQKVLEKIGKSDCEEDAPIVRGLILDLKRTRHEYDGLMSVLTEYMHLSSKMATVSGQLSVLMRAMSETEVSHPRPGSEKRGVHKTSYPNEETYKRSDELAHCLMVAADAFKNLETSRREVHLQLEDGLYNPMKLLLQEKFPQAKKLKDEHNAMRLRTNRTSGAAFDVSVNNEQYKISSTRVETFLGKLHQLRRSILHQGVYALCVSEFNAGINTAKHLKTIEIAIKPIGATLDMSQHEGLREMASTEDTVLARKDSGTSNTSSGAETTAQSVAASTSLSVAYSSASGRAPSQAPTMSHPIAKRTHIKPSADPKPEIPSRKKTSFKPSRNVENFDALSLVGSQYESDTISVSESVRTFRTNRSVFDESNGHVIERTKPNVKLNHSVKRKVASSNHLSERNTADDLIRNILRQQEGETDFMDTQAIESSHALSQWRQDTSEFEHSTPMGPPVHGVQMPNALGMMGNYTDVPAAPFRTQTPIAHESMPFPGVQPQTHQALQHLIDSNPNQLHFVQDESEEEMLGLQVPINRQDYYSSGGISSHYSSSNASPNASGGMEMRPPDGPGDFPPPMLGSAPPQMQIQHSKFNGMPLTVPEKVPKKLGVAGGSIHFSIGYEDLLLGSYETFLLAVEVKSPQNQLAEPSENARVRVALNIPQKTHTHLLNTLKRVTSVQTTAVARVPPPFSLLYHLHVACTMVPESPEEFVDYQSFFTRHLSLFLGGVVKLPISAFRQAISRMSSEDRGQKHMGVLGVTEIESTEDVSDDFIVMCMRCLVDAVRQAQQIMKTVSFEDLTGLALGVDYSVFNSSTAQDAGFVISEADFQTIYPHTFSVMLGCPPLRRCLAEILGMGHLLGMVALPSQQKAPQKFLKALTLQVDMYIVLLQSAFESTPAVVTIGGEASSLVSQIEPVMRALGRVAASFGWAKDEHLKDLCFLQACIAQYASTHNQAFLKAALDPLPGTFPLESPAAIYEKASKNLAGSVEVLTMHKKLLKSILDRLLQEMNDYHEHFPAHKTADMDYVLQVLQTICESQQSLDGGTAPFEQLLKATIKHSVKNSYQRFKQDIDGPLTPDTLKGIALQMYRSMQTDAKIYRPVFQPYFSEMFETACDHYLRLYEADVISVVPGQVRKIIEDEKWESSSDHDTKSPRSVVAISELMHKTLPVLFQSSDQPYPTRSFVIRMVSIVTASFRKYLTWITNESVGLDKLEPGPPKPGVIGSTNSTHQLSSRKNSKWGMKRGSKRGQNDPTHFQSASMSFGGLGPSAQGLEKFGLEQLALRCNALLYAEAEIDKLMASLTGRCSIIESLSGAVLAPSANKANDWMFEGLGQSAFNDLIKPNNATDSSTYNPFLASDPSDPMGNPFLAEFNSPPPTVQTAVPAAEQRFDIPELHKLVKDVRSAVETMKHRIGIRAIFVDLEMPLLKNLYNPEAEDRAGMDGVTAGLDECLGAVFTVLSPEHVNDVVIHILRCFALAFQLVLLDGGANRVFDLSMEWRTYFADDLREVKDLFIARNEEGQAMGLSEEVVEKECDYVQRVVQMFSSNVDFLIEKYERGPHNEPFTRENILCLLSHLSDKKAQKYSRKIILGA